MKISLISGSHRKGSESKRISGILQKNLNKLSSTINTFSLNLGEETIPLWSTEKKIGKATYKFFKVSYV